MWIRSKPYIVKKLRFSNICAKSREGKNAPIAPLDAHDYTYCSTLNSNLELLMPCDECTNRYQDVMQSRSIR